MTPAELKAAKKARNIELYEARNKRLKERQTLANELRKQGFVGSDESVVRQHENKQREAAQAARIAAAKAKEDAEQTYVHEALNGPSGKVLVKWLAMRVANYDRVKRFFDERPNLKRVLEKAA